VYLSFGSGDVLEGLSLGVSTCGVGLEGPGLAIAIEGWVLDLRVWA